MKLTVELFDSSMWSHVQSRRDPHELAKSSGAAAHMTITRFVKLCLDTSLDPHRLESVKRLLSNGNSIDAIAPTLFAAMLSNLRERGSRPLNEQGIVHYTELGSYVLSNPNCSASALFGRAY